MEKNKEVLKELGKCWISFEDMLGKNLHNFQKTLKQRCATLEEQVPDKVSDVKTLRFETLGQLNAKEEKIYSLFRERKTQINQRFESLDSKFNNLVHLLQEKNQAPQRMEEQEVPLKNERYNSVPRESLEIQSSRRPSPMDRNISGFSRQTTSFPNNINRVESSNHSTRMILKNCACSNF